MEYFDATHCLDLTYDVAPFTAQSTSNTAVTITNTLPANTLVSFVMMKLDKAWDAADTESVLIVSGIPTDTDRFLASTQIAADGTEVFFKNTTFEYSTQAYAGTNCMIGILNTNYPAWYISATTNILTTLTPNSLSAFSTFTAGRVRLFFKIYSP
jgi:hypothetical protein